MDLRDLTLKLLRDACVGKGHSSTFLSSYQLVDRCEPNLRKILNLEHGMSGEGGGQYDSAAHAFARVCVQLAAEDMVEIVYMDTDGVQFRINGQGMVTPGNKVCALYRAR